MKFAALWLWPSLFLASALAWRGDVVYSTYSSAAQQAVQLTSGTTRIVGVQVDNAATGGRVQLFDSIGSTTGVKVLLDLDASVAGSLGYHGQWDVYTTSGLIYNNIGGVRFRLDVIPKKGVIINP